MAISVLSVALAGCASGVQLRPKIVKKEIRPTLQIKHYRHWWQDPQFKPVLNQLQLVHFFSHAPEEALRRLHEHHKVDTGSQVAQTLAGLAYRYALEKERTSMNDALGWHLYAAAICYDQFQSDCNHPFRDIYNRATEKISLYLHQSSSNVVQASALDKKFSLVLKTNPQCSDAARPDKLQPTHGWTQQGLRKHWRQEGLGATFVAYSANHQIKALEKHIPPEGLFQPMTAILHFSPPEDETKPQKVTLTFHDPRAASHMTVGGKCFPLEADYTLPWAALLSQTGPLWRTRRQAVVRPDESPRQHQLYLMEPYDPSKIPVLMIHGLWSTPLAWQELTNELMGNPELRRNYQVWHYLYPTGLPLLHNSAIFRRQLEELRALLDPENDDFATQNLILIAHSMGGLLARTLVTESGDSIWNCLVALPPEQIHATAEDIFELKWRFYFEPKDYIKRVIFIAVPHRGSRFASSIFGDWISRRIRLPKHMKELINRLEAQNPGIWTASSKALFLDGAPNSIQSLSPEASDLRAMANLPIDSSIPFHSIMGNRGLSQGEKSSDGIVPYWSSHLEGAESEFFVPTGHRVPAHPLCIKEITRILTLHAAPGAFPETPSTKSTSARSQRNFSR